MSEEQFDSPLDDGIAPIVVALRRHGVETYESCQGGEGHAFPEPTVRFHGHQDAGYYALGVVLSLGLPVAELRRVWQIIDGEATGPEWEVTFVAERL